jgi:hypothetical protein
MNQDQNNPFDQDRIYYKNGMRCTTKAGSINNPATTEVQGGIPDQDNSHLKEIFNKAILANFRARCEARYEKAKLLPENKKRL